MYIFLCLNTSDWYLFSGIDRNWHMIFLFRCFLSPPKTKAKKKKVKCRKKSPAIKSGLGVYKISDFQEVQGGRNKGYDPIGVLPLPKRLRREFPRGRDLRRCLQEELASPALGAEKAPSTSVRLVCVEYMTLPLLSPLFKNGGKKRMYICRYTQSLAEFQHSVISISGSSFFLLFFIWSLRLRHTYTVCMIRKLQHLFPNFEGRKEEKLASPWRTNLLFIVASTAGTPHVSYAYVRLSTAIGYQ